jgi:hypothetical protein
VVVEKERTGTIQMLEATVSLVILLAIVQTFVEDLAVVGRWSEVVRVALTLSGFFFDLFFTVEFLTRLYFGLERRRGLYYIRYERGWIDFLASIPLLVFASGPPMIAFALGVRGAAASGSILGMLKLVKAIRIARILRLLRVLKIFKSIKYAESPMAQRHVARIIATSITVFVFALFGYSTLAQSIPTMGPDPSFVARQEHIMGALRRGGTESPVLKGLAEADPAVMIVRVDDRVVYSRYNEGVYAALRAGDYEVSRRGPVEVVFDLRARNVRLEIVQSQQNMFFFVVVVLTVLAYLLLYSPHFAITVSDPIHVMRRGMSEPGYNLAVRIPEAYFGDDVFRLADLYNENYLPLKDRSRQEEGAGNSELRMEDLGDLFEG